MQSRMANVALGCLKLGGAGYFLSIPVGHVSLAAGEATYAGSLATVIIAGSVWKAADKRAMARLTASAKQALAQARTADRPLSVELGGGVTINVHRDGQQIY
jgi:hypothetical protein